MNIRVEFTIPGPPVPKARPRVSGRGGVYTPAKSRNAEAGVAIATRELCATTFTGPVTVELDIYENRWRGDVDNIAKLLLDGMEKGGAFKNDRQVSVLIIRRHRDKDADERVEVAIEGEVADAA